MRLIVKKCTLAKKVNGKAPESKYVIRIQIKEDIGKLKAKRAIFSHSDEKLAVGSVAHTCNRVITWRSPEGFDWLIGAE